jgi:hypothetical protein
VPQYLRIASGLTWKIKLRPQQARSRNSAALSGDLNLPIIASGVPETLRPSLAFRLGHLT